MPKSAQYTLKWAAAVSRGIPRISRGEPRNLVNGAAEFGKICRGKLWALSRHCTEHKALTLTTAWYRPWRVTKSGGRSRNSWDKKWGPKAACGLCTQKSGGQRTPWTTWRCVPCCLASFCLHPSQDSWWKGHCSLLSDASTISAGIHNWKRLINGDSINRLPPLLTTIFFGRKV